MNARPPYRIKVALIRRTDIPSVCLACFGKRDYLNGYEIGAQKARLLDEANRKNMALHRGLPPWKQVRFKNGPFGPRPNRACLG